MPTPTPNDVLAGEDLVVGDSLQGPSATATVAGERWIAQWNMEDGSVSVSKVHS